MTQLKIESVYHRFAGEVLILGHKTDCLLLKSKRFILK